MPKDTFFNLPAEKRDLISQVAVGEFADYSFEQASINRIVAAAGIAKGSFYQYFDDKKDLFAYVLQIIAAEKVAHLSPVLKNPAEHDLFSLLRELFLSALRFAASKPKYAQIAERLMADKDSPVLKEVMASNMPSAYQLYQTMLEGAIARGEVRPDIDVQLFAYLIGSLSALVTEYYLSHVSSRYDENMLETIDKFLDFLKHGIAADGRSAPR